MKRYILAFIAMFVVLSSVSALNIGSGENYTFNYTDELNESQSEDFACLLPSNTTTELVLDPGASLSRVVDHVRIDASCNPATTEEVSKCTLRKRLSPGDDFEFEDGSCDIQISVDDEATSENALGEYIYEVPYTLKGNNYSVYLSIDGVTYEQTVYDDYTISDSVTLACPESVNFTNRLQAEDAVQACAQYAPLLLSDWIKPTLDSCRTDADERAEILETCAQQRVDLEQELSEQRVRSEILSANLTNVQAQLGSANSQMAVLEDRLEARNSGILARNIMLILQTIALFLVGGFAGLLFFGRARGGE